jgi:molybdopterin-guanine dinucleotide biosynthesis protein B
MFRKTILATIAVIGHKKSGKTTLIRSLLVELRSRGLRVMSAKHVDVKGFTMDTEGRDTWWHSNAGANPVVCVSDLETTIIYKRAQSVFSLRELPEYALKGTDLVLLEGFSRWVLKDRSVAKIVMVRDKSDYEDYLRDAVGRVLCVCSYSPPRNFDRKMGVLNAERDMDAIVGRVMNFVKEEKETYAIFDELPGLNCGKCGYESCFALAEAIKRGEASKENCVPISLRSKLRCRVVLDEKEIPLQAFVSEIIRRSILGMLSSLKGVEIKGDEFVEVKVSHH